MNAPSGEKMREIRMSNVIKFERPPEPKTPKPKKTISPGLRKVLVWVGVAAALAAAWGYFTLFGSTPAAV
jgi:hypothetical protein